MLQECEGDHGHQRVAVEPRPGPTLEVVEAEFLLQLLVCLFAHSARLDRCREGLEISIGGQVGEVVFPLT